MPRVMGSQMPRERAMIDFRYEEKQNFSIWMRHRKETS